MVNLVLTVPEEFKILDRLGVPAREWDIKLTNGTFVGVIELIDDGYMYTDSFGHLTSFVEGETFGEVVIWVALSMNQLTLH